MESLTYFLLLCISLIQNSDAIINWSNTYHLKATLTIPSAQVTEPYEVWVNNNNKQARVDFYGGLDKLFRETSGSEVKYYKVFPETTESVQNKITCEEWNVTAIYKSAFYLPVKDFKFIANEIINGDATQKWEFNTTTNTFNSINQVLVYTVWITFKENHIPVPKRYEYKIHFGDTVFEYFRHDYEYYNDINIDNDFYKEVKDLKCTLSSELSNGPLDPLLEFIDPQIEEERIRSEFEKFKENHSKQYFSHNEHNLRKSIFKNNLRYINSINRQHKSYRLGINHFADLTDAELGKLSGIKSKTFDHKFRTIKQETGQLSPDENLKRVHNRLTENADLPKTFDWRDYNAITPIKDQTILCGSCYAFTTAAAIESAAYVSGGCKKLTELSEQAIIDCTWSDDDEGNLGCSGGTYEFSLDWIKKHGLPSKDDYGQYLAQDGLCHITNITKPTLTFFKYHRINDGSKDVDMNIKKTLRRHGPLMAAINLSPKSFMFYKSGVYDDSKCRIEKSKRDHAVTVVGYGQENGKDYWLLKNSWSSKWGLGGYMKIANAYNVCGVKNFLYYVVFKKNHSKQCFRK